LTPEIARLKAAVSDLSTASRELNELKTLINRKDKELQAISEQKAALDNELFAEKRRAEDLRLQVRSLEQQLSRLQAETSTRDDRIRRLQEEAETRSKPAERPVRQAPTPAEAGTGAPSSSRLSGGFEERQLRDELAVSKERFDRLQRETTAANMEVVKVSEENGRLKDKIFALVTNMKEFDQVVKKIERELARCEDTRNILCYHLEKLIGPVAGGPASPDLNDIQLKSDRLLSCLKLSESRVKVLEEHLAREKSKFAALGDLHQKSPPPPVHRSTQPGTGSGLKSWMDRPVYFERSLSPQRSKQPVAEGRTEHSPFVSAGLRSFSGSKHNTPDRLFDHRRQFMLNYHRDIDDLKLHIRSILDSAEPVSVEARSVADYYTAALRSLESRLLDIVRRAEQNSAGVAEAVRQAQQQETPRPADRLPQQSRSARSTSQFVQAAQDLRFAGGTPSPLRARSKGPFGTGEPLFKGDIREMYQEGPFSSINEELAGSLLRSDAAERGEPDWQEGRKVEEFLGNLRYILESIGRLRGKCGQIKKSYAMIDSKVFEMLRFLQKKNPLNEAIGHLSDFLDSSMARSMDRSLENLDKLDGLCYKLDVRRVCLNSIMSKKNIFHN